MNGSEDIVKLGWSLEKVKVAPEKKEEEDRGAVELIV